MILLTAQRQQASGEMSLLAQPEVKIVQVKYFQILIGQLMPILYSDWLMFTTCSTFPQVQSVLQSLVCGETSFPTDSNPYSELTRIPSLGVALGVTPESGHSKSPPPVIANNLNLLTNTQSLTQLLGVISSQSQSGNTTATTTSTSQTLASQQPLQPTPESRLSAGFPPPPHRVRAHYFDISQHTPTSTCD